MADARRCEGCRRVTYDVARVALLVDGQLRAERELCPACRTNAIDSFKAVSDGMRIQGVTR